MKLLILIWAFCITGYLAYWAGRFIFFLTKKLVRLIHDQQS